VAVETLLEAAEWGEDVRLSEVLPDHHDPTRRTHNRQQLDIHRGISPEQPQPPALPSRLA
jgi:hypothetical protein